MWFGVDEWWCRSVDVDVFVLDVVEISEVCGVV